MDRHPSARSSMMGAQDEEEQLGLLDAEKEECPREQLAFEDETWSQRPVLKPGKTPYLRIAVVSLLLAWTIGFIVHSFLLPYRKELSFSHQKSAHLRPEEDYILDPNWDFDAAPTTREYTWTITEHELNPDGVFRPMILINNTFPGPLIECNEGDEIVVHVRNRASNATSIHWHGLYQNGTNWMDGAVGTTQCPIAPGHDFTYRFRVDGQSGTYYYHSHVAVQHADGLVGPLVIHSRDEELLQKIPYGEDRVVLLSDHYWELSSKLLMEYLAPGNENDEPVPPSAVINGRNKRRDCSVLPGRNCSVSDRQSALFDLSASHNIRLRFANVGAFAEFSIQIDEHEFYVSEVDGTDVYPQSIHRLNINPAQRYSVVIVPPKQEKNKGLYWMRARMINHCFAYSPVDDPELQDEVRGVIRYRNIHSTPQTSSSNSATENILTPTSLDWPEIIETECRDLNTTTLHPIIPIAAPATTDDTLRLTSTFQIRDWKLARGYLNDSSWRPNTTHPTLNRILSTLQTDPSFLSSAPSSGLLEPSNTSEITTGAPHGLNSDTPLLYTTRSPGRIIDILIHNLDDGNHPFHLHGHKFFVLGQGSGPPPVSLPLPNKALENPLRRDTASVEAYGWVWIRFIADNPGVWSFHCHISWHSEAGLVMEFAVGVDEMEKWKLPGDVGGLCEGGLEMERGSGPGDGLWVGEGRGG